MTTAELSTALPEIVTAQVPGPKSKELLDRRDAAIPKALCGKTYPICIKQGAGAMFEDLDGNKFLDWVGGVGVLNIGYSHPEVIEAVKKQTEKYFHTIFNVYVHDGYVTLAERLNEIMPCRGEVKKTYFANSGAECDENAVKIAKAFTKRSGVICFTGAFHGRTNLTMALTAKKVYAVGMGPFPPGIYRAPYPYLYRAPKGYTEAEAIQYYIDELNRIFDEGAPASEIACMIVEPFQGEGGFIPAPVEWVKAVRKICDDNGILMICDEVQCGMGRSGAWFAWQQMGITPDIMTMAKAIGSGVPVGAFAMTKEVADNSLVPGDHGTTYGGNPLCCAAVSKTIEIFEKEHMLDHVNEIAPYLTQKLQEIVDTCDAAVKVKGRGLIQGLQITKPIGEVTAKALEEGLLIIGAGTDVIRMIPPLVIGKEQVDEMAEILKKALA